MDLALWVVEGPQRGAIYPLPHGTVRIGRGMDCDVILADPDASRVHAELRWEGGHWILQDAGSRNGTQVNGVPAKVRRLGPGDRIRIGSTDMKLIEPSKAHPWVSAPTPLTVPRPAVPPPAPPAVPQGEEAEDVFEGLLGSSPAMQQVFGILEKAFSSESPVLVTGESGTGKELVARALHRNGPARRGPCVVVHCAALSPGTLESELFGHEKGAFTGAHSRRLGRFEMANGGTVFLDEVGEIPPETQAKLLRVLETGEFQRVGGNETLRSRFRLVSATNRDLEAACANGGFRKDLYYRLGVIRIHLPPLRERTGDARILAAHYLRRFCAARSVPPKNLAPDALELLEACAWPGNIRELKNRMEALALFHEGDMVDAAALRGAGILPGAPGTGGLVPAGRIPRRRTEMEKDEILRALQETGGNKKKAADLLGIARRTLYDRIEQWNLKIPPPP